MKFVAGGALLFWVAQSDLVQPAAATGFYQLNASTALKASKPILSVGGIDESTAPFSVAAKLQFAKLVDRHALNGTGTFPLGFGFWDLATFAAPEDAKAGQYPNANNSIFIPIEEAQFAGVFRYDVTTKQFTVLALGKGGGDAARNINPTSPFNPLDDEFVRLGTATYTPFNTLLVAERTNGTKHKCNCVMCPFSCC